MDKDQKYPGPERRRAERIKVNFKARWAGARASRTGDIADLSLTGCFILTPDLVSDGETITLEIELPGGGAIKLAGVVVYKIEEMGFAIHFTNASKNDKKQLAWLIKAESLRAQRKS